MDFKSTHFCEEPLRPVYTLFHKKTQYFCFLIISGGHVGGRVCGHVQFADTFMDTFLDNIVLYFLMVLRGMFFLPRNFIFKTVLLWSYYELEGPPHQSSDVFFHRESIFDSAASFRALYLSIPSL